MSKGPKKIHHDGVGDAIACLSLIPAVCLCLSCCTQPVRADVTWYGDIDPEDPTTWDADTEGYIGNMNTGVMYITNGSDVLDKCGYIGLSSRGEVMVEGAGSTWTNDDLLAVGVSGNGTLNVTYGGAVSSYFCIIGESPGSTGEVTVNGSGSTLTNRYGLYVGRSGSGTLNITSGGEVNTKWASTWVAKDAGSSGTINFDNGTLTTRGLLCGSDDLTGTGTINTRGLVSDVDLVFDATRGLNQTFSINDNPGQNITVNLNADGSSRYMGAGYSGVGTMSIFDGRVIESVFGFIGYKSSSLGEVTVDGPGSTWTNSNGLYVGHYGSGTLNITDGGAVSDRNGYIGGSRSTGEVTVDGPGSTWTNSYAIYVGSSFGSSAIMNVTGGGAVSSEHGSIGIASSSTAEVIVDGPGSMWTTSSLWVGSRGSGTLNITDGGAVSSEDGAIGFMSSYTVDPGSLGEVTVDGPGSTWTNSNGLYVGHYGSGTLNITDGGLVSVAGSLTIDYDEDGDGFINIATGGMLALYGDNDDSLFDFLRLINGTDAIRYWDDSASGWADITGATYGQDYTLSYLTEGDLVGYTVLAVPEPTAILLFCLGVLAIRRQRRV